jgi:hypothetical protein
MYNVLATSSKKTCDIAMLIVAILLFKVRIKVVDSAKHRYLMSASPTQYLAELHRWTVIYNLI